jgi:hypothetical protein
MVVLVYQYLPALGIRSELPPLPVASRQREEAQNFQIDGKPHLAKGNLA